MNIVSVKISEEDCKKLQALHFMVEAKVNLISRLVENKKDYSELMNDYISTFKEYSIVKEQIEQKYKPENIKDLAISWNVIFSETVINFEVPDATA